VAALCARSAVRGAFLNVRINSASLSNKNIAIDIINKGKMIEEKASAMEAEVLRIVNEKLGQ